MNRLLRLLTGICLAIATGANAAAVEIVSPRPDATVHDNAGNLSVTVDAGPGGLQPGQRIRLLLDGKPAAPESGARVFMIGRVDRGEHRLQAELLDAHGDRVSLSREVVFHMWRASKNLPARKP